MDLVTAQRQVQLLTSRGCKEADAVHAVLFGEPLRLEGGDEA